MPDPLFPLSAPQNPSQQPGQQKQEIGEVVYNVEFNDSVLSTKTWNNPRYDGCKTKTQELNKFTQGDITYGKKTAVQKYTRNIYVGEIITSCSGSDDPNLVPFPNFSYVSTTKYITVNDDDNINEVRYSNNIIDEKIGFYRSFQEDFSPGTNCQVYLLNEGIVNSLEDKYEVVFNEGRLKKISLYEAEQNYNPTGLAATHISGSDTVGGIIFPLPTVLFGTPVTDMSGSFTIYDNSDLNYTYTGSNVGTILSQSALSEVKEVFNSVDNKLRSEDLNDRYFITFYTSSNANSDVPIINSSLTKNEKIQTVEVFRYANNTVFGASKKYRYPKSIDHINYYISRLNQSTPSILINLPKNEHLPNGLLAGQYLGDIFNNDPAQRVGPKFVIIPENLHPYIKENINYFLIKAGLMEENNKLTINPKNRQLS